ncbi:acireductone synthase [Methylothermus subterraneus]
MIQAVLTDIEGTTSSLSFVQDLLFPYARARLENFVRARQSDPEVQAVLAEMCSIVGRNLTLDEAIAQLLEWSDADAKIPPLKALQGMIWEAGYRAGELKGHVYPDAVARLKAWHAEGYRLYIFSSGSVAAQKLLFEHTPWGDLTGLFSGFFDTRTGSKRESASYRKIAAEIGLPPQEVLFLSDVKAELDAAQEAGMKTVWVARLGDSAPEAGYPRVCDFSAIDLAKI